MKNIFTGWIRLWSIVAFSGLLWQLGPFSAQANPTGGTVSQGTASFNPAGSQLTVNTSDRAFINWQSFNIGAGETTTFVQPSSSSLVWNQINDPNPSQILGSLNANGYVVLQNQSGFYIGGSASISTHGLVMTTASSPAPNLSSGGAWQFNTPPPAAQIINYGQINLTGGGSVFLIANDIENYGTISAPSGKIGLYAGQQVLVSTSPDGRGLSAQVTLPQGSVDNEGNLIADAGSIVAQAQTVNQNGLVQANSVQSINGVIELVASDNLTLGASSDIEANGDTSAGNASASPGGFMVLHSGNTYADTPTSLINVSGQNGGQNGIIEIIGNNLDGTLGNNLDANSVQSIIGNTFATLINPFDITLSANPTDTSSTSPNLNVNDLANYSQVDLQALDNIELGSVWTLPDAGAATSLNLSAGNNITLDDGSGITAGNNRSVTLTAGNTLYLNGTSSILTQNGDITLLATAMQTINGVNINVTATSGNIELGAPWTLSDAGVAASINLSAGNNITLDNGAGIQAGNNWNVNLTAGTVFAPTTPQPTPTPGSDGIYLNDNSYIQARNGNITLNAANEVLVAADANAGNDGIRTLNGGNIAVTAQYGDVNTGANPSGYQYTATAGRQGIILPPYYTVSGTLGGISTAAGGNVTISAGGDVTSYLPGGTTVAADAGTGAFGTQPGNVTISAGGNVYGHYVLANGVGTINAGQNVGAPSGLNSFALSLIAGSWNVYAGWDPVTQTVQSGVGNIYLQEVRNPRGIFDNNSSRDGSVAAHTFDYAPQDSVTLDAGSGVDLTDLNLPRLATIQDQVPVIYPPILDITAGSGGVTLQDNVTLFPSIYQNLNITTTAGGSLVSAPNNPGSIPELLMSDSSQTSWSNAKNSFSDSDHSPGLPVQAADPNPVLINISGDIANLNLITSKETQITVRGDMINSGFSGQNLHASDVTSITVAGQIYNRGPYDFVYGVNIPSVPAADLLPLMGSSWDNIFTLALDPAVLATLTVPADTPPSGLVNYILQIASLFQTQKLSNGQLLGANPGFVYNPTTGRLGFAGDLNTFNITAGISDLSVLTQPITILHLVNGVPVLDTNPGDNTPGRTYGQFETDTVNWVDPSKLNDLAQASAGAPSPKVGQLGYRLGGPGQFDVNATSIDLGNTYGILSCGVQDVEAGYNRYADLASITPSGATVNVTVSADQTGTVVVDGNTIDPHASLAMLTSTIAAIGGGDVNVTSTGGSMDLGSQELFGNELREVGFGIINSGNGSVNVTALGDIDINGSRIASYNGGNIFIESLQGNVNAGSGGATYIGVPVSYVDPVTGLAGLYREAVYGSGIVANTLVDTLLVPGSAKVPGNITVETPQGNIVASQGGILQEALNGNISAGPTITLVAGTPPSGTLGQPDYTPGYAGNIDLGDSGVIGGTVNVTANGNITGLVISRQNSDIVAAQNFSGTVLSGGSANVSGGGSVSGTIVGVVSATVSGGGGVTAQVLSQNANVGGAAANTLGATATATSTSQSAANQANNDTKTEVASTDNSDEDQKKKKVLPLIQRVKRVTVILPKT